MLMSVSSFSDSTTAILIVLKSSSFSNRFPKEIYINVASKIGNASVQNNEVFARNIQSVVYFML